MKPTNDLRVHLLYIAVISTLYLFISHFKIYTYEYFYDSFKKEDNYYHPIKLETEKYLKCNLDRVM
ncbi:hypothetical protein MXB_1265 [Myxobolus squamalis]|nr:hypothetical protein MXB_1265 [Myxobolus squamalis]